MNTTPTIPLNRLIPLMRHESVAFEKRIGTCSMQLSIPTDGKGVRVKVSVQPGHRSEIPNEVTLTLDDQTFVIPLEVEEDYQNYVLH